MIILRPLTVVSSSVVLCAVAFAASAQIRPPLRPLLLPLASSSASSVSSVSSALSSTSSMSSLTFIKPIQQIGQKISLKHYCKDIAKLLKKAEFVTRTPTQDVKFNLSVDMLTKANALCGAMLEE